MEIIKYCLIEFNGHYFWQDVKTGKLIKEVYMF